MLATNIQGKTPNTRTRSPNIMVLQLNRFGANIEDSVPGDDEVNEHGNETEKSSNRLRRLRFTTKSTKPYCFK